MWLSEEELLTATSVGKLVLDRWQLTLPVKDTKNQNSTQQLGVQLIQTWHHKIGIKNNGS